MSIYEATTSYLVKLKAHVASSDLQSVKKDTISSFIYNMLTLMFSSCIKGCAVRADLLLR